MYVLIQEELRNRITISWSEMKEDANDYSSSEDDDDNNDNDNDDYVEENEECPPIMDLSTDNMQKFNDAGIYDFEISNGSDTDYSVDELEGDSQSEVYGFKLVADNLDKNFRPSFQRLHNQTISVHHFHAYAVADRVNFSGYSEAAPQTATIDPLSLLPSKVDLEAIEKEFQILITRYVYGLLHYRALLYS